MNYNNYYYPVKANTNERITKLIDASESVVEAYKNQDYEAIKRDCIAQGKLFEDPLFPASDKSIFYTKPLPSGVVWKRPNELTKRSQTPSFVYNQANACELDPGYFGNRWFIAACAAIAYVPDLFSKVVPSDQTFGGRNYTGAFQFRFFIYGQWYSVVVDDRLPVYPDNKLVFCNNKYDVNEFWAPLLEKAYAKLYGSYENLDNGQTLDALVDMSGGIGEKFSINDAQDSKYKDAMWDILKKARMVKTLMGASISLNPHVQDTRLHNGLAMGYLYIITRIAMVEIKGRNVRLIRLLSSWTDDIEWKGAWSPNSKEWSELNDELKIALEFHNLPHGEFWISYDDFYASFHTIEFCNVPPDAYVSEKAQDRVKEFGWKMTAYHGVWTPGSTAGGCGQNNEALYWTNPQFLISLYDVDVNDDYKLVTVIVSLMQKNTRENRKNKFGESTEEFIQFRFYRIINDNDAESAKRTGMRLYASQLKRFGSSGKYINVREVTKRFRVPPGNYLIVPSCYDANKKGDFMLRVFTENAISDANCKILDGHKDNLTYDDLFYFTKNNDELYIGWRNLLNEFNEELEDYEKQFKKNDILAPIIGKYKTIQTPVFETFDKLNVKKKATINSNTTTNNKVVSVNDSFAEYKNCILM